MESALKHGFVNVSMHSKEALKVKKLARTGHKMCQTTWLIKLDDSLLDAFCGRVVDVSTIIGVSIQFASWGENLDIKTSQ